MKYVTLKAGRWSPSCPCGSEIEVIRLAGTNRKMVPYCWMCGSYSVEFTKMEENIYFDFSKNWNGKLNCDYFTTIRLANRAKYYVGARGMVRLEGKPKGMATIIQCKQFLLNELNEFTSRIDTGLPASDCSAMLRIMYKNKPINWAVQPLVLVLLQYDKDRDCPKLDF